MIMPEEDDVESRNVAGDIFRLVLIVVESAYSAVPSAMEETDYHVGILLVSDDVDPFGSRFRHILEMHSAPQFLVKPIGYRWCYHTNHCYPHSLALDDGVGLDVWFASGIVDNVCPKNRAIQFANPFVIHGMPRLHVMVAHRLCVVSQPVDYLCRGIGQFGFDKVGVVACGLALQYITVFK